MACNYASGSFQLGSFARAEGGILRVRRVGLDLRAWSADFKGAYARLDGLRAARNASIAYEVGER